METIPSATQEKLPRDLQTEAIHRREVFWQITIPLIIGGTIFFALVILTILASGEAVSQGADVALMWLLILPCTFTVLNLTLLSAMVYGLWKLIGILPGKMYQVQVFTRQVQSVVRKFSDKLVEPFLKVHSTSASVNAFWHSLTKKGS